MGLLLLNNTRENAKFRAMKQALTIFALLWALAAGSAAHACTAEYKAKRDNPTEYRHTTMTVPSNACNTQAAAAFVSQQLASQGWKLLAIVKVSG